MCDEKNVLDPNSLEAFGVIEDKDHDDSLPPEEEVNEEKTAEEPAEDDADSAEEDTAGEEEKASEETIEEPAQPEEVPAEVTETEAEETAAFEEGSEDEEASDANEPEELAEEAENAAEETVEEPAAAQEDKFLVEYPKEEFEALIAAHFRTVAGAVMTLRSKEESITRLSKDLQKYREGFAAKSFKAAAMAMIDLREASRKALANLDKPTTFDKICRFMEYLVDDVDDLLTEIGLECEKSTGYVWVYNGTPIFKKEVESVRYPELFELEERVLSFPKPGESLTEYLKECEEAVLSAVTDITGYDKCIEDYVKLARAIDDGLLAAEVYPVLRALAHFAPRFKADVTEARSALTEENAVEEYARLLTELIEKLEILLEIGGVEVEPVCEDIYNVKKHKIIKLIPTEDESLDRAIESVITDCYTLNSIVISPAKIFAYKYQAKKA